MQNDWVIYKPPRPRRPHRPRHVPAGRPSDWGLAPGHQAPGTAVLGGGGHHAPPHPPTAGYTPKTSAQLNAEALALVRAGVDPQIVAARQAAEERARSGMAAIGGYTKQLADSLAGYLAPVGHAYDEAKTQQGAVTSSLADRLSKVGEGVGSSLASTLAGQPNAQAVSQHATETGAGASNAGFARGSAELSRLIAEGAHAQEYVAKQPGIAGLTGLQHGRDLQAQTTKELMDTIRQLESGVPAEVARVALGLRDEERQNAAADQAQRNWDKQFGLAKAAAERAGVKTDAQISHQERADRLAARRANMSYAEYLRKVGADKERARENLARDRREAKRLNISVSEAARRRRADAVRRAQGHTRNAIAQQNANTSRYRAHHPAKSKTKVKTHGGAGKPPPKSLGGP